MQTPRALGWLIQKNEVLVFVQAKPTDGGAGALLVLLQASGNAMPNIPLSWQSFEPAISPILGTTPDPLIKTIHYVDPLVLDLDGDGLEITPLAQSTLFDANGDAIKTATAWVGKGDGVFDANDSAYNAVRVWTDANQDGISQAAELHTLADSGVSAITLASAAPNTNYGDAVLVRSGSFTRADGSSGQAGSFILAQNAFVREFAPIAVSQAAQALPDIGGSGWLRDLQEAATLDPQLIDRVQQASAAGTRADFREAIKALLLTWSAGSGYSGASALARADGYGLIRIENVGLTGSRPENAGGSGIPSVLMVICAVSQRGMATGSYQT